MKKKIMGLIMTFVMLLSLTGCGNSNITLDLEKIKTDLMELKSDNVSRVDMASALASSGYFANVMDVYDFDLANYGITKDYIEIKEDNYDFSFAVSDDGMSAYFIGKAKDDKLIEELDNYFSKYTDYSKEEVEGYTVYVASSNNDEALKLVRDNAFSNIYNSLVYASDTSVLSIDSSLISEYLIATPMFITSAEQYIILKPIDGKEEEVKELMNTYMSNLQQQWDTYLPAQAELVKNREETKVGDYLVYIISSNNNKVLDVIKKDEK